MLCGSSERPGRRTRRSCPPLLSRRGPFHSYGRSSGHSCCRSSHPNLRAYFHAVFDSKQFLELPALASDVLHVKRAVDLAPFAPGPDHATYAQHPQVPRNPRLAHAEVDGEIVDVLLPNLPQALQDAQAGRVGKGQKVIGKLVTLAGQKHKACFMSLTHKELVMYQVFWRSPCSTVIGQMNGQRKLPRRAAETDTARALVDEDEGHSRIVIRGVACGSRNRNGDDAGFRSKDVALRKRGIQL